ncbi:MAG: HAD-IIA family hydrolase [candidate division Zixibacteria bacterium]|nr:HAD-IIA family hydrolase [candidate division Zixibacteria bacterium]
MRFKYYLIDIEGTLVKDKTFAPVEGAPEWLAGIAESGGEYFLVTNNTTHTPDELYKLMRENGFDVSPELIFSCISSGGQYLLESGAKTVYVIGSDAIIRHLTDIGIEVRYSEDVDAVVVGLDENLTYDKLRAATTALVRNDATLCAMHKNRLYVDKQGRISFSSGPVAVALEYASQKEAYIAGKPSKKFFQSFLDRWGCSPEEVLMVSDDPFSDLRGAKQMGMKTCFVASGSYPEPGVLNKLEKEYQPDYIYDDVTFID